MTTSVGHYQFQGSKIDLRLFKSQLHLDIFQPIIYVEAMQLSHTHSNIEFYGHVQDGANTPPERSDILFHKQNSPDRKEKGG